MSYKNKILQFRFHDRFSRYSEVWKTGNSRLKFLLLLSVTLFLFICILHIDISFYTSPKLDINTGLGLFPSEFENFREIVDLYRNGDLNDSVLKPINTRYSQVDFLKSPQITNQLGILIIVKSARSNYQKRRIIRKSWGNVNYLNQNILAPHLPTKVLFLCGESDKEAKRDLQYDLKSETHHKDMIVAGFTDSYYNNTYKSLVAFKWAITEFKGSFKYLALFDDDIYVDMVNLGGFLRQLKYKRVITHTSSYSGYPYYVLTPRRDSDSLATKDILNGLYIGRVVSESVPDRKSSSKWFTSHEDYPYNMFPPYIPGAGMVLDHKAVSDMYYGSMFVKHFWIDDVYLGIVAAKLGIIPFDERNFLPELKLNRKLQPSVIAQLIILHGFECPAQIFDFWYKREMKHLEECTDL